MASPLANQLTAVFSMIPDIISERPVNGYVPSADLKSRGVAYVATVLLVSFALAWIERAALDATAPFVV